jgi:hypothetical protein
MAHFQSANQALIVFTADSLGTAPHFTSDESIRRRELAINLIMAFLPTEPVQTILASLVAGNYMSIMDGFRETNRTVSTPAQSGRARMISVAQTRTVVGLVRELRVVRKEALAAAEADLAARATGAVAETGVAFVAKKSEAEPTARRAPAQTAPAEAPYDPDEAGLHAVAADFQPADAITLETPAEAGAANPEGAEAVRPGLAESIQAALAEPGQSPIIRPPNQTAARPMNPSRAQRKAERKRKAAFRRTG